MANPEEQKKFKVLLVDDEENVLKSLKRLFMDEDFEIIIATSGREGLEIIRNNEIAVILSDQKMPEMNGAEFLEKSREISPDSVRLILTGYADINAAIAAINKGGASRYLSKPWDDNNLLSTVREAVERCRLVKENAYLHDLTKKQNEKLEKWNAELEFYVQKQTIDLSRQNKELEKLLEKGRKNLKDFITAFTNLIELRNKFISSHSNNVASLSAAMANKLGLSGAEIETLTIAAYLHDIGKVGSPDIIFLKDRDELTPEEMQEYMKHPVAGQSAVDSIEDFKEAGRLIRHHHEWYNGGGFPDRLKGDDIPLGSRILSIADGLDELIHGDYSLPAVTAGLKTVHSMLNTKFEPGLYKFLAEVAKENAAKFTPTADMFETELSIKDIMPGMVLSKDMRSGTGILLLRKGITLDAGSVDTIKRSYYLDPSGSGIFVFAKRK